MYAKESYCNNNIMYDFIDVKFSLKKNLSVLVNNDNVCGKK